MFESDSRTVLLVTPALSGGTWVFQKELADRARGRFRFVIAGLGSKNSDDASVVLHRIRYPRYDRWGFVASNPACAFVYELPLLILTSLLLTIYRPRLVLVNGFFTSVAIAPVAKLIGTKVVLSHHVSDLSTHLSGAVRTIVRSICHLFVALVLVNSPDAWADASFLVHPSRLVLYRLWAHRIFFSVDEERRRIYRNTLRLSDKFVVLYVGRMDAEKLTPTLLKVINKLRAANDFNDFHFMFIGEGSLIEEIRTLETRCPNVRHQDYISDREELCQWYAAADVLWSFADVGYISRPAVEALATGTPLVIPDVPALMSKQLRGVRIRHDLILPTVGWVVSNDDVDSTSELVLKIKREAIVDAKMRACCRDYASKQYGPQNMETVIEALRQICENKS